MSTKFLLLLCVAVLCTILTLGLWPFHSPENDVTWLDNRNGLRFGRFSTVLGAGVFPNTGSPQEASVSLEIWLQPRRIWDSGTFLTFYSPGSPFQFSLHQSQTDLLLQTELLDDQQHTRTERLSLADLFSNSRPAFLTITSGAQGTLVYSSGVLAKAALRFRLPAQALHGRLVLGDSPGQTSSWSGQLLGLAVYQRALPASRVSRHYQTWTKSGRPEITTDDGSVALYLCDEHTGNLIHNRVASDLNLNIPERYKVADQIFLEPFWKEFRMSRSYWQAALKNIIGFVPLGFSFYAWLSAAGRMRRPTLWTVVLGTVVSVTIEVLQAYLPTRDSGTTDIFTNTLGTWIGVVSYPAAAPLLARALQRRLPVSTPRRSHSRPASGQRL